MQTPREYIEAGFVIVPVPFRSKNPGRDDWPEIRVTAATVDDWFDRRKNIGVHLGPSGIVDVDLDTPEAVKLAPQYLEPTATFGRESKRASHWIYDAPGKVRFRKFIDPIDKQTLLEVRSGQGLQTVFPGSMHETNEPIEWDPQSPRDFVRCDPTDAAIELAVAVWKARHPGEPLHPRVKAWRTLEDDGERVSVGARQVHFSGMDRELVEEIVRACPENSRHDYRLAVAGAMLRAGVSEEAAAKMLAEAMGDRRLGRNRSKAVHDARAAVSDTYSTTRNKTGTATLLETFGAGRVVERITDLVTPDLDTKIETEADSEDEEPEPRDWLEDLLADCIGDSESPLTSKRYLNRLAELYLKKDSRLPSIWARVKTSGWPHLRELKEAVKLRAAERRTTLADDAGELEACRHEEAEGMHLPLGYRVERGRLMFGEQIVIAGELELLAKCPTPDGTLVRFAWRSSGSKKWRTSLAPYRSLVETRAITVLAEHGLNLSSLESELVVSYVRDFVQTNEKALERPIAVQTGWHESGAFVWGRTVIDGPTDLRAEYPADNQIALRFVEALHAGGKRSTSYDVLADAVTRLPSAALCIAASFAAPWIRQLGRSCIGVHLAGMGGRGKTRTLKIAASVWGESGNPGALAARGVIAGANTTARAFEIAAGVRCDLPFLVSDVRPFPQLAEVLHAVLNGDARARATQRGGATLGAVYTCGAVISEGELNVLHLTTRQGLHRRVFELAPDLDVGLLWQLGELASTHYGYAGPASLELGPPSLERMRDYEAELAKALKSHEAASAAATLLAVVEHVAPLLEVSADRWARLVLRAFKQDRASRAIDVGLSQADRAVEDLREALVLLAPQIADSLEAARFVEGTKPWVGYRDGDGTTVVIGSVLRRELDARGHHAIGSVLEVLVQRGALESQETERATISAQRVRCYRATALDS